jgi:hypothetical protein
MPAGPRSSDDHSPTCATTTSPTFGEQGPASRQGPTGRREKLIDAGSR